MNRGGEGGVPDRTPHRPGQNAHICTVLGSRTFQEFFQNFRLERRWSDRRVVQVSTPAYTHLLLSLSQIPYL